MVQAKINMLLSQLLTSPTQQQLKRECQLAEAAALADRCGSSARACQCLALSQDEKGSGVE
jgi:hypothetical protein